VKIFSLGVRRLICVRRDQVPESKAAEMIGMMRRPMSASHLKADIASLSRHVR